MMFTLRRGPNFILAWCDWINVNLQVNSLDTVEVDLQKLPKKKKKTVLRSRHFFWLFWLRKSEVPEPTPAPTKSDQIQ